MRIIGLTGGIGSGKSTVTDYLRGKGFPVIDADQVSRELVVAGSPLLKVLTSAFGSKILQSDGALDRKQLGNLVFHDSNKRRQLEDIMHEKIHIVIWDRIKAYRQDVQHETCFIDVPLLFEAGFHEDCDATWLIIADQESRIQWLQERDKLTIKEIETRMKTQMSDEEKKQLADVVIENNGSKEDLYQTLEQLLKAN